MFLVLPLVLAVIVGTPESLMQAQERQLLDGEARVAITRKLEPMVSSVEAAEAAEAMIARVTKD